MRGPGRRMLRQEHVWVAVRASGGRGLRGPPFPSRASSRRSGGRRRAPPGILSVLESVSRDWLDFGAGRWSGPGVARSGAFGPPGTPGVLPEQSGPHLYTSAFSVRLTVTSSDLCTVPSAQQQFLFVTKRTDPVTGKQWPTSQTCQPLPSIPQEGESEVKVAQSCPTLCDPTDNTVHGILQARILEWVAFPFSRASS